MNWTLEYAPRAQKQLDKLDPYQRRLILTWMHENVDGTLNPRAYGKSLSANHAGVWVYRIGVYRVLVDIQDERLVVLALKVSHRRAAY